MPLQSISFVVLICYVQTLSFVKPFRYGQETGQLTFELKQVGMLDVFGLMRYNYLFIKHGLVLVDLGTQGQFAEVSHVSHFLGNFYCKLTLQSLIFSLVLFQPVEGIARATNTFASPSKYLLKFISNDIFSVSLNRFYRCGV